jgi:flagellar biosynthetic protein FlhB
MPEADSGEKTELATEKRMKEVRAKGQLAKSQDLTAWVAIGVAAVMIPATVSAGAEATSAPLYQLRTVMDHPDRTRCRRSSTGSAPSAASSCRCSPW